LDLKGLKPDNRCFLNELNRLYLQEMVKIVRSSSGNENVVKSKAENSELAQLIDDKKWVSHAYESERYVLMSWVKYSFSSNGQTEYTIAPSQTPSDG